MNILDIVKARRRSGRPPTLKGHRWNAKERALMEKGLCVKCGGRHSKASSYLCAPCEGEDSLEDIRSEIRRLRSDLLGR